MGLSISEVNKRMAGVQSLSDLNELISQLDVYAEGDVTVLYSGGHEGVSSVRVAELMASDKNLRVIDKTQAAKFLASIDLRSGDSKPIVDALGRALGVAEVTPEQLKEFLQGKEVDGKRVSKGAWDIVSRNFARETKGEVRTMVGYGREDRVFHQTEVQELLGPDSKVTKIDGQPAEVLRDIARTEGTQAAARLIAANSLKMMFFGNLTNTDYKEFIATNPGNLAEKVRAKGGMESYVQHLNGLFKSDKRPDLREVHKDAKAVAEASLRRATAVTPAPAGADSRWVRSAGALAAVGSVSFVAYEAHQAWSAGDGQGAKDIVFSWGAETLGSTAGGVMAGSVATLALGGLAAATPVGWIAIAGMAAVGGIYGGEGARDIYNLTGDIDGNNCIDLMDRMFNVVVGADKTFPPMLPPDLIGKSLTLDASFGREQIVANALREDSWRYALRELNPFVIPDIDYSRLNEDGSLDLFDAASDEGVMTETYMRDAAAMLTWQIRYMTGAPDDDDSEHEGAKPFNDDWDSDTIEGNWQYVSLRRALRGGETLSLYIDGVGTDTAHRVVFGTQKDELLEGGEAADRLYAGVGADSLLGGEGNDYLEGGLGDDVYLLEAGQGIDTIFDADGVGSLQLDGETLSGGKFAPDNRGLMFRDEEHGVDYLFRPSTPGSDRGTLTVFGAAFGSANSQLVIKNFHLSLNDVSDLGLVLEGAPGAVLVAGFHFDNPLVDTDYTPPEEVVVRENATRNLTLAANVVSSENRDVLLSADASSGLFLRVGSEDIPLGSSLAKVILPAGRTTVTFTLVHHGDPDADVAVNLQASVSGTDNLQAIETSVRMIVQAGHEPDAYDLHLEGSADDPSYRLVGGDGADLIEGKGLTSQLEGRGGDDRIYWDSAPGSSLTELEYIELMDLQESVGNGSTRDYFGDRFFSRVTDQVDLHGNDGNDTLVGSAAWERLAGSGDDDFIHGGGGADVVIGDSINTPLRSGADRLYGGFGDDIVTGEHGQDIVSGGEGGDFLFGGWDEDMLVGGPGNDVLYSDVEFAIRGLGGTLAFQINLGFADILEGNEGDDVLSGGGGGDLLFGGDDNDTLRGGSYFGFAMIDSSLADIVDENTEDEILDLSVYFDARFLSDDDYLDGGEGNDKLEAGVGNDQLWGGAGDDLLLADYLDSQAPQQGNDTLYGESGKDSLVGYGGADSLSGGADDDELEAGDGDDTLSGGENNDVLRGGSGQDHLAGDAGNDVLLGDFDGSKRDAVEELDYTAGQADLLQGGAGNDTLVGQGGNDTIDGGADDDDISGDAGDDEIRGGAGKDLIYGDNAANFVPSAYQGADYIDGGDGNDTVYAGGRSDTVYGGEGADMLGGGAQDDALFGGIGDDSLFGDSDDIVFTAHGSDELSGDEGNDYLAGYGGNDQLDGGADNDLLLGMDGDDTLDGGGGNDTLNGGDGADWLQGGAGDDVYVIEAGRGTDFIVDMGGTDVLQLGEGVSIDDIRFDLGSLHITNAAGTLDIHIEGFNPDDALNAPIEFLAFAGDGYARVGVAGLLAQRGLEISGSGFILGTSTTDKLQGGVGNDLIEAGAGNDQLSGGDGEDALYGDGGADSVLAGNGDDLLFGGDGNDTLIGGAGIDWMVGGAGNDNFMVDDVDDAVQELPDGGDDSVLSSADYSLTANVERLTLSAAAHNGVGNDLANTMTGNEEANRLAGEAGSDTLYGNGGGDTLDGGQGNDVMAGGAGDDLYIVDATGDMISELAGAGFDEVSASSNYTLPVQVERLVLAGTAALDGIGNTGVSNEIIGNDAANRLIGGGGTLDVLWGNGGDDVLGQYLGYVAALTERFHGGAGNDVYHVMGSGTFVFESADEGFDTIYAHALGAQAEGEVFVLPDNVEELILDSGSVLKGAGNQLDNVIRGNSGSNLLQGWAGNDLLTDGGGSRDTLDGGSGIDTMNGGDGSDLYYVDHGQDVVMEYDNGASSFQDEVLSTVDYVLGTGSFIENLTLVGETARVGTGNDTANRVSGNAIDNTLHGLSGADTLLGGAGMDHLEGGVGFDHLDGGTGIDRMLGGRDGDTYFVDNSDDVVIELAGEGEDRVIASQNYTLSANVEVLVLAEDSAAARANGNGQANHLIGNYAANTLDGFFGDDTLQGGSGDDLYLAYLGAGADQIFEIAYNGGVDTLRFGEGIDEASLNFSSQSGGWRIGYGEQGDSVFVAGMSVVGPVENFVFASGATYDVSALMAAATAPAIVTRPDAASTAEDELLAIEGNVLTNDSAPVSGGGTPPPSPTDSPYGSPFDPPGVVLPPASTTEPAVLLAVANTGLHAGVFGDLFLNADGSWRYTLRNDESGVQALSEGMSVVDSFAYVLETDVEFGNWAPRDTLSITVAGRNDAPHAQADLVQVGEDQASAVMGESTLLSNDIDVDAADRLVLSGVSTLSERGVSVTLVAGVVTYESAGVFQSLMEGQEAHDSFRYVVADAVGATSEASVEVVITGANDAPVVVSGLADRSVQGGTSVSFQIPDSTFADIDEGDSLTVSASMADGSSLPSWLTFDSSNCLFQGTAPSDAQQLSLRVFASDLAGASAEDVFVLDVVAGETGHLHGNAGVGNGEDAPPPGHSTNHNDGPGTGPGNPGSAHGGNGNHAELRRVIDAWAASFTTTAFHLDLSTADDCLYVAPVYMAPPPLLPTAQAAGFRGIGAP